MKKISLILGVVAAAFIALAGAPEVGAVSAEPNGGGANVCTLTSSTFYANGTAVTISADTDPGNVGGTLISWNNDASSCAYTSAVATNLRVYGGYLNSNVNASYLDTTNITVNGGLVYMIYGGSAGVVDGVGISNIVINGGTVSSAVRGGGLNSDVANTNITFNAGIVGSIYGAGGSNTTATKTANVNIIMNGGTLNNIFGGGQGPAVVDKVNINITGGTIVGDNVAKVGAVSAGGAIGAANYELSKDMATAVNIVKEAVVNIGPNVQTVKSGSYANADDWPLVYAGGGNAYTYVGTSNVTVAGGDWARVIAASTAGYVESATVTISGGNADVVQGINRGGNNSSTINITGGTVGTLFAGADAETSRHGNVLGTVGQSTVNVTGGKVINAEIGYDFSGELAQQNAEIVYLFGTVDNLVGFDLSNPNATMLIPIVIDGATYTVEDGKTLADYDLNGIRVKDGYKFLGFFDTQGNVFDEATVISEPITLVAKFELIPVIDKNPDTSDSIALFAIAGLVGVIGLGSGIGLIRVRR